MSPAEVEAPPPITMGQRVDSVWKRYKWFSIVVLIPTLIVTAYLYLVAADQYVSEAHYLVRTQSGQPTSSSSGGLTSLLSGGSSGASLAAAGESLSVSDYLTSHDVVDALQRRLDIVALFRRPEADWFSKLSIDTPTPEFLLKYYRKQVDVHFDTDTGITTMTARAFRPADAYALSSQLLQLGERRVNEMNIRGYSDAVSLSKRQLDESERALRSVGAQVTNFRQSERDVDPRGTAAAQISLVSNLQAGVSAARAQLATTTQLIGSRNPQTEALRQQIASLEQQINAENARLAGNSTAIAAGLGNFEALQMQQTLLQQRYASASAAYESARQNAVRQQLYLVRVVEPNMPVKSLYPKRGLTILTIFAILTIVYAIGWLIMAGVKEHSV